MVKYQVKYHLFNKKSAEFFPWHAIRKIKISQELLDRFEPNKRHSTCNGLQVPKKNALKPSLLINDYKNIVRSHHSRVYSVYNTRDNNYTKVQDFPRKAK